MPRPWMGNPFERDLKNQDEAEKTLNQKDSGKPASKVPGGEYVLFDDHGPTEDDLVNPGKGENRS